MRQYETASQAKLEREIAFWLASQGEGYRAEKLPKRYVVDWSFWRGVVLRRVLEIKRRHHVHDDFGTLLIGVYKMLHGWRLAEWAGVPFALVIRWDDCLGHLTLDPRQSSHRPSWPVRWGGRTDRGDDQDMEPVHLIPVSEFRFVRGGECSPR